ncbi:hypothetical protein AWC12_11665 [Mycolicibacterium iranicum]|uniref:Translation initiation factor IF-2 n=1 Tax=Mycolicibacterium iranicum TaxID=912594 RepID=A0A1X1WPJ8_MYCIR|nr:hypothetical protein AWC12_11665 [Mycolicibacterium iranicum]
MVSGGLPPLKVNPEELAAAGNALNASALDLPEAPAPFMPVGTDPLSVAIIGQIPAVETPILTQLPLVKTQATTTAGNVVTTAQEYAATDARNGAAINQAMQNGPLAADTPATGGATSAAGGGADQMGQMMNMPMQIGQQMAQMPMQVMGAVAAVPQGLMQGVQQAGQQVQQMAGQFGQGATGSNSGADSGAPGSPAAETPAAEPPVEQGPHDGASSGDPDAERAPDPKDKASENSDESPGRHRAAETDDRIDL